VFTSSRCQRAIASGAPLIFQRGAADCGKRGEAAGVDAQERLVIQFPQSTKKTLENHAGAMLPFCGIVSATSLGFRLARCGNKNDYGCGIPGVGRISRARNATNESSRTTCIRWAGVWLESASRVERLTALIEDRSKEPTPAAEYVWQLPPFQFHACEWAQLAALGHSADLMFGNSVASRGRIRHPNGNRSAASH